jgi:hypothetical protein
MGRLFFRCGVYWPFCPLPPSPPTLHHPTLYHPPRHLPPSLPWLNNPLSPHFPLSTFHHQEKSPQAVNHTIQHELQYTTTCTTCTTCTYMHHMHLHAPTCSIIHTTYTPNTPNTPSPSPKPMTTILPHRPLTIQAPTQQASHKPPHPPASALHQPQPEAPVRHAHWLPPVSHIQHPDTEHRIKTNISLSQKQDHSMRLLL